MPSTMCLTPRQLLCCFNLLGMKDISTKRQCENMHERRANRKWLSGTIPGMILMIFKLSLIELVGCKDKSASNQSCQSCRRNKALSNESDVLPEARAEQKRRLNCRFQPSLTRRRQLLSRCPGVETPG